MWRWELGQPRESPVLSREEAIDIALADELTPPNLRGLPVDAEYGFPRHVAFRGDPDVWKVTIDVSSLGWDMTYEGPGPKLVNGEMRYPSHVRVPKVHALVILIHDKMKRRIVTGTEPEPDQEHRIEWRTRSDYRRG